MSALLLSRRATLLHEAAGPQEDPYSRETLRVVQAREGAARQTIDFVQCALAGTALVVNGADGVFSDEPWHLASVALEFERLVGASPHAVLKSVQRREAAFGYRSSVCMACGRCCGGCYV